MYANRPIAFKYSNYMMIIYNHLQELLIIKHTLTGHIFEIFKPDFRPDLHLPVICDPWCDSRLGRNIILSEKILCTHKAKHTYESQLILSSIYTFHPKSHLTTQVSMRSWVREIDKQVCGLMVWPNHQVSVC